MLKIIIHIKNRYKGDKGMKKLNKFNLKRRAASVLLAVNMLITSLYGDWMTIHAAEELAPVVEVKYQGQSLAIDGGDFSAVPTVEYGIVPTFQVSGETPYGDFYYCSPDQTVEFHNFTAWTAEHLPKPGNYYVGFEGENDVHFGADFGIQVTAGKLESSSGLTWEGTKAVFGKTEKTTTGVALVADDMEVTYSVQLFCNEEPVGDPVATPLQFVDFGTAISGGAYGTYRYTVSASVTDSGYTDCYEDSDSISSGEAVYEKVDSTAPVISSYGAGTDAQKGHLVAKVQDAETGVSRYAFSKAATAGEVNNWKTSEAAVAASREEISLTEVPNQSGFFYFYAQNPYGATVKSEQSVAVTKVVLQDYYVGNTKVDGQSYYILADDSLSLEGTTPSRTGYDFNGWYDNALCSGEALTSITPSELQKGKDLEIYAGWSEQQIEFVTQPEGISKTYNGETVSLTTSIKEKITGDISITWYKKSNEAGIPDEKITEGVTASNANHTSTLMLKDCTDSGDYYAEVKVVVGSDTKTKNSDTASVSIGKRTLKIKIKNLSVGYQEALTEDFDFVEDTEAEDDTQGLVGGDSFAAMFAPYRDRLSCSYQQGDPKGNYDIVLSDDTFALDNYEVVLTAPKGSLTVEPKDLTDAANIQIRVKDPVSGVEKTQFTYTGSAIHPTIEVTMGGEVMDAALYDVDYSETNCVNAGTVNGKIAFKGSYTGSKNFTFEITKANFDTYVILDGWTYGDAANTPALFDHPGTGAVTYYYTKANADGTFNAANSLSGQPKDAGTYYVYAKIAAHGNYEEVSTISNPTKFEVAKRVIILRADKGEWNYDGNKHFKGSYTQEGEMVGEDDFQYRTVTGSITEIGEVPNVMSYAVTASTNENNYDIQTYDNVLIIHPQQLPVPADFEWYTASEVGGEANWIAVTRKAVEIIYELELYRVTENGSGEKVYTKIGETISTEETRYDFSDVIKTDSKDEQYGYTVRIKTLPVYAEGEKHNYLESDFSEYLPIRYTGKVTVVAGTGTSFVTINGTVVHGGESIEYLALQGENLVLTAWSASGYTYTMSTWSCSNGNLTMPATGIDITCQVNESADGPFNCTLTAACRDANPFLRSFELSYDTTDDYDYSYVNANFHIADGLGLGSYAIADRDDYTDAELDWHVIAPVIGTQPLKEYTGTEKITKAGTYFVYIRDIYGNRVVEETNQTVYEVKLKPGTGTGEEKTLLKINQENMKLLSLDAIGFSKTGYSFLNWSGSTGLYSDGGIYAANKGDTLTALWTNVQYEYTVEYYYMDLEGNYSDTPDDSKTFKGAHGSSVAYNSNSVQLKKIGFTLDEETCFAQNKSANTAEEIFFTESDMTLLKENQVMKLYYSRNRYRITYSYSDEKGVQHSNFDEYYYGADVTAKQVPKASGYTFVGWDWGDAGQAPAQMPNNNLTATGEFHANVAEYTVYYYLQNLDQSDAASGKDYLAPTFAIDPSLTETMVGNHGDQFTFAVDRASGEALGSGFDIFTAKELIGFEAAAVKVTYQNAAGTTDNWTDFDALTNGDYAAADGMIVEKLDGEVPAEYNGGRGNGPLTVSFYYTRKTYNVTLSVYKDAREKNVKLYEPAAWTLPFGYVFGDNIEDTTYYKAADFEVFGHDSKGLDADGKSIAWTENWPTGDGIAPLKSYMLATFVDWSTGSRPETMPAGDVAITREYVLADTAKFTVNVWFETITNTKKTKTLSTGATQIFDFYEATGTYELKTSFERYGIVNSMVYVVDSIPAEKEADATYITFAELINTINYANHYEHNTANDLRLDTELAEGRITVDSTNQGNLVLDIHYVRKEMTAYVVYNVGDGDKNVPFAYSEHKQKWGTSYMVDPLYYFDGATTTPALETGDTPTGQKVTAATIVDSGKTQNFRANGYVVSCDSFRYWTGSDSWDPGRKYTTATGNTTSSLVDTEYLTGRVGYDSTENPTYKNNRSYVRVYYTPVDITQHYYMKLQRETKDSGAYVPVTATYNGTDYEVRLVNKADVFEVVAPDTSEIDPAYANYPGAYYLNYGYTYQKDEGGNEILRDGFTAIQIDTEFYDINGDTGAVKDTKEQKSGTYYLKDSYIYVIDPANPFYYGNKASLYLYGTGNAIGYDKFIDESNWPEPEKGRKVPRKHSTSIRYLGGGADPLGNNICGGTYTAYYYDTYNDFYITYHYDGKSYNSLDYNYNDLVEDIGCDYFSVPEGYHISWYWDAGIFSNPVKPFNIKKHEDVYGQREKDQVANTDYAYYKLPQTTSINGVDYEDYITDAQLDDEEFGWVTREEDAYTGSGLEAVEKTITLEFTNEYGVPMTGPGNRTEFYVDGVLVAVKQTHYAISRTEFTMDYEQYQLPGYEYDKTNTGNKSKAYCIIEPVKMYAYYMRSINNFTISRNRSETDNDETTRYVFGYPITLEDPQKDGYDFDGWKLQIWDAAESTFRDMTAEERSEADYQWDAGSHTATMTMPAYDTKVIAKWKPVPFDYTLSYYFQNDKQVYDPELLSMVDRIAMGTEADGSVVEDVEVVLDGADATVTSYYVADALKAMSYTTGGVTYYYTGMDTPEAGEKYQLDKAHLFAAKKPVSLTSEDAIPIKNYGISIYGDMFEFAFVSYQQRKNKATYTNFETDTFDAYTDMVVGYYYARNSACTINTIAISTNSSDTGATLTGGGDHYYGEKVKLYATIAAGYTYLGWYRAEDVLEYVPEDGNYRLVDDYASKTKLNVGDSTDYEFVASGAADFVVITTADAVAEATVSISGKNEYEYGYEADAENVLTGSVAWNSGSAGSSAVSGYQWYVKYYAVGEEVPDDTTEILLENMLPVEAGEASAINFKTGKDAGTYVYRLAVHIKRKDNGLENIIYADYNVEVSQRKGFSTGRAVSEKYDAQDHSTEALVSGLHDYDLYYAVNENEPIAAEDEVLTQAQLDELLAAGKITTEEPKAKDVIVDNDTDKNVVPHVFYYYVKSKNQNYADETGTCSVKILPIQVSVTAKKAFLKVYDGSKTVAGTITVGDIDSLDVDSDKYELSTGGYYSMDGILPTEQNLDLLMDFEAEFNTSHVKGSASVTLTNMWMKEIRDHRIINNYNYQFTTIDKLSLSGEITPYPLTVEWDTDHTSFIYDGAYHAPDVYLIDTHVPDGAENIILTVHNQQKNAGTFHATVEVSNTDKVQNTDYTFSVEECSYTITPRYVKAVPTTTTKYYNGKVQTITECTFYTKDTLEDEYSAYDLPDGEEYSATFNGNGTLCGDYTVAATSIKVLYVDENGVKKNGTGNYVVELGSGTLTIAPCPVKVTNITALDKNYDGTTDAQLDRVTGTQNLKGAQIVAATINEDGTIAKDSSDNIIYQDKLFGTDVLAISGVTGQFADAAVGTDKEVTLSYATSGKEATLVGDKATQYTLIVADSQTVAYADIKGSALTVTAADATRIYGETPSYELVFTGFQNGEDEDSVGITGTATFVIKKLAADGQTYETVTDSAKLPVGTYRIYLAEDDNHLVEGISAENYLCQYDGNYATLTVSPRPITITDTGVTVVKEYDGDAYATDPDDNSLVSSTHYQFTYAYDSHGYQLTESGVLAGDSVGLSSFDAIYDTAATSATTVTLSNMELDNANYTLQNETCDLPGQITKKALVLKVSDVEITYGDAIPDYSIAVAEGYAFVDADQTAQEAVLAALTNTAFACDYLPDKTSDNRRVGTYTISFNEENYTNDNYEITYSTGELTVAKKTIYYKADDKSILYGKELTMPTYTAAFEMVDEDGQVTFCYDETPLTANILYQAALATITFDSGKYVVSEIDSITCSAGLNSPAGTYDIIPQNVDKLSSDNYAFEAKSGTLTVEKHYIVIDGVCVNGKEYDGTRKVAPEDIVKDHIFYTYYENGNAYSEDTDHMTEDEKATFLSSIQIVAMYQTKDAGENKPVDLQITLVENSYLDQRYILVTTNNLAAAQADDEHITKATQIRAYADILSKGDITMSKRGLHLKPTDTTVKYGEAVTVTTTQYETIPAKTSVVQDVEGYRFASGEKEDGEAFAESFSDISFVLGYKLPLRLENGLEDDSEEYTANDTDGYAPVGTYYINLSSSSYTSNNYEVSYELGELTVVQNKLATPAPAWDTANPGTVTWKAIPSIGAVAVKSYEVKLYKNGEASPVMTKVITDANAASNSVTITGTGSGKTYNMDLAELITDTYGEGSYTVTVQAMADDSADVNEEHKNVADSAVGSTLSAAAAKQKLKAVLVSFVYDQTADSDTVKATNHADSYTTVNGNTAGTPGCNTVVMLAGTENVDAKAFWKNADGYSSGYTVASVTSNLDALTIGNENKQESIGKYNAKFTLADSINEQDLASYEATVTLTLEAVAAEVAGSVTGSLEKVPFGYTAGALVFTATVTNEDTDTYDYSYSWVGRKGLSTTGEVVIASQSTGSTNTLDLPAGLKTYGTYYIYCTITATRKDNGETATVSYNSTTAQNMRYKFAVVKATPDASNSVTITKDGWQYGDSHFAFAFTPLFEGLGEITAQFNTVLDADDAGWTTTVPTDYGTYYIRGDVAASDDYEAFQTTGQSFTITQNQLDKPDGLLMTASSKASYGVAKWNTVSAIVENAGVSPKSQATPEYVVTLYKINDDDTETLVKTYRNTDTEQPIVISDDGSHATCDLVHDINIKYQYKFKVQALAQNAYTDASNTNPIPQNVLDSEIAESEVLHVSDEIAVTGEAEKVYDGKPVVLAVGDGISYKWFFNGSEIPGETNQTISLYYVSQSGTYSCEITKPVDGMPDKVYASTYQDVKITPRPITIVSKSAEKNYDGTALTTAADAYSIVDGKVTTATYPENDADATKFTVVEKPDQVQATITGTQTLQGSSANTIQADTIRIYRDADSDSTYETLVYDETDADFVNNYTVTRVPGTLTVTTRSLESSGITVDDFVDKVYDGTGQTQTIVVRDAGLNGGTEIILTESTDNGATGDYTVSYSNNIHAGTNTAEVTITGINNYSGTITKTFSILQRAITIQTAEHKKAYDGTPLTSEGLSDLSVVTAADDANVTTTLGLASGDKMVSAITPATITNYGSVDNTFNTLVIKNGNGEGDDVTADYDITPYYQKLIIEKAEITATLADLSKTYDKQAVQYTDTDLTIVYKNTTTAAATNGTITFTYYKVTMNGDTPEYTALAADAYPVNAGTYAVTAEIAEGSNFKSYTIEKQHFTISPLPVVLTWSTPDTFAYDGTDKTVTATVSNKCAGDVVNVASYVSDSAAFEVNIATEVHTYKAIADSLGGAAAENYTLVGGSNLEKDWSITAVDRTIAVENVEVVYDANEHEVAPSSATSVDANSVTYEISYAKIVGASKIALGDGVKPVHVGVYEATVKTAATNNYLAQTTTATVTITKRAITITSKDAEKVYDGKPLTMEEVEVGGAGLTENDSITGIDYGVSITNVLRENGQIQGVENTFSNVVIANSNVAIGTTTDDYSITPAYGTLTIKPYELTDDDLTLTPSTFNYDGQEKEPVISVKVLLEGDQSETVLVKTTDYTVEEDAANGIVTKASRAGVYTVKVIGCGNYTGSASKHFGIGETNPPEIDEHTVDGGKYCRDKEFTITDANLSSVTITKNQEATPFVNAQNLVDTYSYTLHGAAEGTLFTITAEDVSGNTSTWTITVYEDHLFTQYVPNDTRLQHTAPCDHECGAEDTKALRWGTVEWDYNYMYSVADSTEPHAGVQGVAERETHAIVELLQNGVVIATKVVSCEDTCGVSAQTPSATGKDTYAFDSYDPNDPLKASGSNLLPMEDEQGVAYTYKLHVSPAKLTANGYEKVNMYHVDYDELYTGENAYGYRAKITYMPGCFDVPWKVVLKGLPKNGDIVAVPDTVYVKVLYAVTENANDAGYNIISQQISSTSKGVDCEVVDEGNGTYSYSGSYPVWKYIGGTTNSYYHRIQVVGYDYHGHYYDLSNHNPAYRSICDSDHVNHTIYYVPGEDEADDGHASGVILYEIDGLEMTILNLDFNEGADQTNMATGPAKSIVKESLGAKVTAAELEAVAPTRQYYEFDGWYTTATNGTLVEEIESLSDEMTIYAHWIERVAPVGTIKVNDHVYDGMMTGQTFTTTEIKEMTVSISAEDKGFLNGVQTHVINSGMDKIYYYLADHEIGDLTDSSIVWTEYDGSFLINEEGNYIVYAKLVDKAGNVGYAASDGIFLHVGTLTTDILVDQDVPPTEVEGLDEEVARDVLKRMGREPQIGVDNLHMYVEIKNANESKPEEDEKKIVKYAKKYRNRKIIQYLDISAYLKVNDEEPIKVPNTYGNYITVNMELTDLIETMANPKAIAESYHVVRVHDGVAEEITSTFDEETGKITFVTDKFSTYAIVYECKLKSKSSSDDDSNAGVPNGPGNGQPNKAENTAADLVKTGDDASVMLYCALLLSSFLGMCVSGNAIRKRKKK